MDIAIIGAGRMGQGLARALTTRGREAVLLQRGWAPAAIRQAAVVLVAVPDDAIAAVAAELASRAAIDEHHVVLHLSGLLDRAALQPLAPTGAALGSFHPLQTIPDPASALERFEGAYAGVEGDDRAMQVAEELATALRMTPVRLTAAAKPAYHAAAAMVSNYTIALLGVAQRLAIDAGISPDIAEQLYRPLLQGTVANVIAHGPVAALTGPIRRGDLNTIRAHLAALGPRERQLYCQLGLAALILARDAGLNATSAASIEALLGPH